jgi:ribosome-associated protein
MLEPIEVTPDVRVPAAALQMKAVRSGGPGGQNVNKVASKVELRVDLDLIEGLAPDALARLRQHLRNQLDADGRWLLTSSTSRDQIANLEDARGKIVRAVEACLKAPVPRHATRPTRGSQARRVAGKKLAGARKRERSGRDWD